jgi:tetratricopeptide (TPR) repeat protein
VKPVIKIGGLFLWIVAAALPAAAQVTIQPAQKGAEVTAILDSLAVPSRETLNSALIRLEEILARDPKNFEAHLGLVYARLIEQARFPSKNQEGLREALKQVNEAIKLNPDSEDAYWRKSQVLFLLGKKEEGRRVLEGSLKRFPQSLALHEALLLYLIKSGRIREGERLAALAGSKIKDKTAAHIYLGQVWLKAGYPAQADVSFTESLHIQETPEAWAGAAQVAMAGKDWDRALAYFQKALNLLPTFYAVYDDLAFCYVQLKRYPEALKWLESYLQAFPDDFTALGNLAGLYEATGDKVKARLAWMKVKAGTRDPQQGRLAAERLEKTRQQ